MKGFNYHSLRWQNNASYDTFSLDPTPDVPICPSVDNCLFNYYNVSVMHNCTMDIRRHWCVASTFSCCLYWRSFLYLNGLNCIAQNNLSVCKYSCLILFPHTTNLQLTVLETLVKTMEIFYKWKNNYWIKKKCCGKMRNCSLWSIYPFAKMFSKVIYCRGVRKLLFLGEGS